MSRVLRLFIVLSLVMLLMPGGQSFAQESDDALPEGTTLNTARVDSTLVQPMRAIVHARGNHFVVDSVPPLGSPSEERNPLDMLLGALATCPMFIYETAAQEQGYTLEEITVAVEADLAAVGVRDGSVNPRIREFRIYIDMTGPTVEEAEFLRSELKARCPIYTTLERAAPIKIIHEGMDMGVILEVDFTYDLSDADYVSEVSPLAADFAAADGLVWKIWTQNEDADRAGAVYLFESQEKLDAYLESELFGLVLSHPALSEYSVRQYGVLSEQTNATHGPADLASGSSGGEGEVGELLEVNFSYDMDADTFVETVSSLTEDFEATEGLRWKIWAHNAEENTFSGILYFDDATARQAFLDGDLAASIMAMEAFSDMTATDFSVMEEVSVVTRGPIH